MPQHKLIVIIGSSGVGKSTLVLALQEQLLPDPRLHLSVGAALMTCITPVFDEHNAGRMHVTASGRYLRRLTHRVKQHIKVVDSRVVLSHKSIPRTIAANADAFNADMVAIATRKDAANRRRENVAERLVQFASMPVLIVPA